MAKKKVTRKADETRQENPRDQKSQNHTEDKTQAHHPTMEDASEKLRHLKNLNSMLLKETLERRQQVESLNQAKEALETELSQFGVEKSELVAKLAGESEKNVSLEMEKCMLSVFVKAQMREMSDGIDKDKSEREDEVRALKSKLNEIMGNLEHQKTLTSQALRERDLMKCFLDRQTDESIGLRASLSQMEKKEGNFKDEILMLKNENETLMKERNERDRDIEAVEKEKGSVERRLVEAEKEIGGLKGKIEGIAREKKEIEMEKSGQNLKIDELEKEVGKLNEIVLGFQKEETVLRENVLELEKSFSEAMDKEKEMALEINALKGQKREKQSSIERLSEEKEEITLRLETAMAELNVKEGQIAKLLREKNDIEERKVSLETEIVGLYKEIGELRDVVITLKESCRVEEEKYKRLVNEVRDYKSALDRVMVEKDDAIKGLHEEKKNGMYLKTKVSEMEKRIEDKVEELAKIRNDCENLIEENKKMQSHIGLLMEEKELAEKNLLEAKQGSDDLRAKMELISIKSDQALSMLKKTVAMVSQSKDDHNGKEEVLVNDTKLEKETAPFVAELKAIENAFRSKEKVVEEMKQQLEIMKNSVAEAHKKKSFWTVVSSATTIFAAASVAYVARLR